MALVKYTGDRVSGGGIIYVEPSSTGDVVVASTSLRTIQRVAPTRVRIDGTATINGAGAYDLLADITDDGTRNLFGLEMFGSAVRFPPAGLGQGDILVR
jgi:hypothetical protein